MITLRNGIICLFDKKGNAYFKHPSSSNDELYDVVVTRDNKIELDKYFVKQQQHQKKDSEDFIETKYKRGELTSLTDTKTLKGTIKTIHKEEQDVHDPNAEYDSDDDEPIMKRYYPEDEQYNEFVDDEDEYLEINEGYFAFSFESNAKGRDPDSMLRDIDDNEALYDTIVYDGTPEHNTLLFKTRLVNDLTIYRLIIYTNGQLVFRPIGGRETVYRLNLDDKTVMIEPFDQPLENS